MPQQRVVPTVAPDTGATEDQGQWYLTSHVLETAARRDVTLDEVFLVVNDPEVSYSQSNRAPGMRIRQRGLLAVVVAPESRSIVTVLLRTESAWTDEDARQRDRPRSLGTACSLPKI